MAEHFRDFLDPAIDPYATAVLEPTQDVGHRFLVNHGAGILERLGGERVPGPIGSQRWEIADGSRVAVMDIHEPDVVIPAILRYADVGLFYTYTGKDNPLWTPVPELTTIPAEVDSGHPVPDSLVALSELLYKAAAVPRTVGRLAAQATAPLRDARARRQWSMSSDRTKQEIWAHYDLSQDVYVGPHGFLDEQFVQYSSGLLLPGRQFESLEELQEQKIDSLARKLELDSADTLLEVGGGWGGLAVALAQRAPHIHITSLTVSDEQLQRAQQRAEAAGVADRVTFIGKDYRDLEVEKPFDRVVSVEMIEAVDWRDMDTYFDSLVQFVDPDSGIIVIQSINIKPGHFAQHRHNKSFANTAIFPGGGLTPRRFIQDSLFDRGWRTHEATELGPSYALTVREWIRNLYDNRPALSAAWQNEGIPVEKIDRFYRGFGLYLAFCEAGFRPVTGNIEGWQQTFQPI